jgi:hypothetical protein
VDAQEQHGRLAVVGVAFHFGECVQALAGEPFGQGLWSLDALLARRLRQAHRANA